MQAALNDEGVIASWLICDSYKLDAAIEGLVPNRRILLSLST
jgi:hypothetical protein